MDLFNFTLDNTSPVFSYFATPPQLNPWALWYTGSGFDNGDNVGRGDSFHITYSTGLLGLKFFGMSFLITIIIISVL